MTVAEHRAEIARLRLSVRDNFEETFASAGFVQHMPDDIVPTHDKSVLFTGSHISPLKVHLEQQSIPLTGFYIIQRCLRTQNTTVLKEDHKALRWSSYFLSLGALANYDQLDSVCGLVWHLLVQKLRIPLQRLRIRIASPHRDLLRCWSAHGLDDRLETDTRDSAYYIHKFGMPGVRGRNCNIAIANPQTKSFNDIGNIIVIEADGVPIAVEAAFGVETIVSNILGLENSVVAALISDIVPQHSHASAKLADAISASVVILRAGERPIATNRGRVLRKYLQGISQLRQSAGVPLNDIGRFVDLFEQKEFSTRSDLPQRVVQYLTLFEDMTAQGIAADRVNEATSSVFSVALM